VSVGTIILQVLLNTSNLLFMSPFFKKLNFYKLINIKIAPYSHYQTDSILSIGKAQIHYYPELIIASILSG
jgi:hypothetical protein